MKGWVVICSLLVVCADECPDGGSCDDGQTCCKHPTDGYECCPFDQAECCGDHVHCCPAGTTCDTSKSSCVNATVSIPWAERSPVQQSRASKSFRMIKSYIGEDDDNICPDQSRCPAEFSCLRALTKYGCCPLAQGIPCSDGKHCCPEGHSCSEDSRSCIKKVDVAEQGERASNVSCDLTFACPDGNTCCSDGGGHWGCCPFPNAVCCSDHRHCCPFGKICDLVQQQCLGASDFTPMSQKTPAVTAPATTTESQVIEPAQTEESEEKHDFGDDEEEEDEDQVHCNPHNHCSRNSTCCRFGHRRWGCCPIPHAVCCSDSKHCCPQHFNCSKSHQGCVRDDVVVPWYKKLPAKSSPEPQVSNDVPEPSVSASNVTCDPTQSCPDDTTCCLNEEEGWDCCPYSNAVCCSDHRHCCPSGTTCDLHHDTCNSGSEIPTMSQKAPAVLWLNTAVPATTQSQVIELTQTEESEEDDEQDYDDDDEDLDKVHCNHNNHCPRNSTCCHFGHRRWGCCPMPHAVCCSDRKHCCPEHYKCSKSHQACVRDDVVVPWYTKRPAVSSLAADSETDYVRCRDGTRCPPYNTCCLLSSGEYGCCPMENAVCCSDNKHCCPQGYTCDISSQLCERAVLLEVELVPLTPVSLPKTEPVRETFEQCDCPDTFKCCEVTPSQWFCCPYTYGVCCSGSDHCCPQGKRCAPGGGCSSNSWLPWDNWPFFRREQKKPEIL